MLQGRGAALGGRQPYPAPSAAAGVAAIERLHPRGWAEGVVVIGTGAGTPAPYSGPASAGSPADLIVLAPSSSERRSREWAREAADLSASLAPEGLLVAVRLPRRLRGMLAAIGLEPVGRLLHVPDVARTRYVFPLGGSAAHYALRHLLPLSTAKRIAARALALPGTGALGRTSLVFRRPGARPLADWLRAAKPPRQSCTAIVARSWRPHGATVVHRIAEEATPDAVAKIGPHVDREAATLRALATAAGGGEVEVPEVLEQGRLAELPLVVETALPGRPATQVLRGSPDRARDLLRVVARWLEHWNAKTADRDELTAAETERELLEPARLLAPLLEGGDSYLSRLQGLCQRCLGATIPFVAAQNDLTAANVLLSTSARPGIVDWEQAAARCLPLGDLAYAAADLAAAVDGYRDRPAAFADAFYGRGPYADLTDELLGNAVRTLAIDSQVVELCLDACWLHHARNEHREAQTRVMGERPFLAILRQRVSRHI